MPSFLHFCCLFVAQIIDINSYTIDSQSITGCMIDFGQENTCFLPREFYAQYENTLHSLRE